MLKPLPVAIATSLGTWFPVLFGFGDPAIAGAMFMQSSLVCAFWAIADWQKSREGN